MTVWSDTLVIIRKPSQIESEVNLFLIPTDFNGHLAFNQASFDVTQIRVKDRQLWLRALHSFYA